MSKKVRLKERDKNRPDISEPDYEKLGRMLANVYEFGFINKKRLFVMNMLRGIAIGFGSVIGATILVAIVIWFLSVIDFVPLTGPLQDLLQQSQQNKQ